jgi:hypothetical protein
VNVWPLFGVFAIGLVVLLIYKSTLTMHRDDQLFLDDASSHMHEEQTELLAKVNRLTIPLRVFSIGSGVFLLVLVAMLIYQKLNAVQYRRKRGTFAIRPVFKSPSAARSSVLRRGG